jgi:hypothetical protein
MVIEVLFTAAGGGAMKYLFAWMLGVPGVIIFIWFLINHL